MDRILRTMRAGGKGVDSHHLASLTDSKYSVTRTAGVIGAYGFSRFFPQVNLRVEATASYIATTANLSFSSIRVALLYYCNEEDLAHYATDLPVSV